MKSPAGIEYKAHKLILASRCEVLKAHLERNTTATASVTCIESPFESQLLCEVLRFIYRGNAPNVNEIPEKLLA